MEYAKCYVFEPDQHRPAKRQRLEPHGLHRSWPSRRAAFHRVWNGLDQGISTALTTINSTNNQKIVDFLQHAHDDGGTSKIPTGIVLLEPGSSTKSLQFQMIDQHLPGTLVMPLNSGSATNLKTALKSINRRALQDAGTTFSVDLIDEAEDDEIQLRPRPKMQKRGRRLLAYDLQILHDYIKDTEVKSVVIHLEDTEGFASEVLSELIEHLSLWKQRVPLVLLMNVSTSIDMLERRLSKTASASLSCAIFPAATCEEEFEAVIAVLMKENAPIMIGPSLIRIIAQRQSDYLQDISCLKESLKYALMSAYFANPLTSFLDDDKTVLSEDHYAAVRTLPSFQQSIAVMLNGGKTAQARALITDDGSLHKYISEQLRDCRITMQRLFVALQLVKRTQAHMSSIRPTSLAAVYIQGLSSSLRESTSLRGMFLAMRKCPVESVEKILELQKKELPDAAWYETCQSLGQELRLAGSKDTTSDVVNKACKALEIELSRHLIDPKTLTFHEIFLFDLTSPYREVFMPRPRQAIERALSTPHDYLDCDCCGNASGELEASQPASAILYNLYNESGNLINAHDAWQAFQAVVGEAADDNQTMALFQRSLSELKHLGMVKSTRKRVDHIAKVAWPGL